MSVTDEIKSRLDIVEVIGESVPLKKSGSSYTGFCPFHPNTRTPAFVVFPNTQTWRCFGACADGGDIFSFVMKKEGWEFREALVHLAERAGVELKERGPVDKARKEAEDRLADLLSAAADYFHQLLLHAPQAEAARSYVAGRDLSEETVATFKLGYALNSWDACRSHFNMQGYDDQELVDAGLLTVNEEKETRYDRFRNRLMIPIADVSGRIVGFGARTLDPDGIPKYLNSPQTAVFDKSRLLFGLALAKRHIREERQAVIVEGYMDVMQAWQAGYHNVVAQMGTAFTEQQLRSIKRYTRRFILALDADAAGASATLRSLNVARDTLDREQDVGFDVRGLVRHEGRLKADIRVMTLPEGKDPDQIIRRDPALWQELVSKAKPVVAYVIGVVTKGLDMTDGKAKTAAAQQVLPLIGDVVDPVEREHYRQTLARQLRIDERVLHKVATPAGRRPRRTARVSSSDPGDRAAGDETISSTGLQVAMTGGTTDSDIRRSNFLRQCLSYPQLISQVDKKLVLNQQEVVKESDFVRPDDQAIWQRLRQQARRWPVATMDELWDSLEDRALRDRVQYLLSLPDSPESELDRLPDLLVLSVLDWRLEQVRGRLSEVRQLIGETSSDESPEVLEVYRQQLRELPLKVRSLNRARGAMSALGRRSNAPEEDS